MALVATTFDTGRYPSACKGLCETPDGLSTPCEVQGHHNIMLDSSRNHRKALAITRISTFLDSVVELKIGERARYLFQVQYLFSPALFALVRALPAMGQLHTVELSVLFLAETYLYRILSSSHLTHLMLRAVQMPKITRVPPSNPKLRKLTLEAVSWDAVQSLIVHLAASLEYLELNLHGFPFGPQSGPQLPPLPSLRELRHHHNHGNEAVLDEVLHVSQVTHLHLFGPLDSSRIAAFPESLHHLSTQDGMLTQGMLGTAPIAQLISLSIRWSQEWEMNYHLTLSAFVCDHFPGITSLHLNIRWSLRNVALVIARSQHNVRAMELAIVTRQGLDSEGRWRRTQVAILNDYLRNNMFPGVLQSLRLDVVQISGELERSLAPCSRWIDDDIVHPVKGLGGSDLKSIDVSFVLQESVLGRERRIWKRWSKSPDGDWQIEGAL